MLSRCILSIGLSVIIESIDKNLNVEALFSVDSHPKQFDISNSSWN